MPYQWSKSDGETVLTLWPHQSLTSNGFAWFIVPTAVLFALPLLAVLGSAVAWILMACFTAALWAIWRAIMVNRLHRSIRETIVIAEEKLHLKHCPPTGEPLVWEANAHWVRVGLRDDGPVDSYLTLAGYGREVELGAFLTPEERERLFAELRKLLEDTKSSHSSS